MKKESEYLFWARRFEPYWTCTHDELEKFIESVNLVDEYEVDILLKDKMKNMHLAWFLV